MTDCSTTLTPLPTRRLITLSRPTKAPDRMKRMDDLAARGRVSQNLPKGIDIDFAANSRIDIESFTFTPGNDLTDVSGRLDQVGG